MNFSLNDLTKQLLLFKQKRKIKKGLREKEPRNIYLRLNRIVTLNEVRKYLKKI